MDREFPRAETSPSGSGSGAEIGLIPNCCTLATEPVQSDVRLAQARGRAFAVAMGLAVANDPVPCAGHCFGVDPNGTVFAMASDSPCLAIATLDLELIRKIRNEDRFRWCLE